MMAAAIGGIGLLPVVAQNAGNAENGKKLFFQNGCYECHGTVGQGGTGPRLAPRPLAAAALTAYVRKPGGGMPPYSAKVMSDAEVADIRAYLATVPEPPKEIPLLKP
jgi:ubiquinol-cytochrome c reductase cytochrome c subunit